MSLRPVARLTAHCSRLQSVGGLQRRCFSQPTSPLLWSRAPRASALSGSHLRPSHLVFARHESTQAHKEEKGRIDAGKEQDQLDALQQGQQKAQHASQPEPDERGEVPAYELTFTCKPCQTRSAHRISKHGYHKGTVLITCPNCKNRHVISDHLKIFNDKAKSFEEILQEKAQLLKTGVLDPEGDFEMWDDGTQTARDKEAKGVPQAGATPSS